MSEHVTDKHDLVFVKYFRYQPECVAADIEDCVHFFLHGHAISTRIRLPNILYAFPMSPLCDPVPSIQLSFKSLMPFLPLYGFSEFLPADNPQSSIASAPSQLELRKMRSLLSISRAFLRGA
jgi:hypothetical protein